MNGPNEYARALCPPVHLFWTGGWDSSYRLCQLVIEQGLAVQPIYVHQMREAGGQRLCLPNELQAIEYMREDLRREFPISFGLLRPLAVISPAEVHSDTDGKVRLPEKQKGPGLREGWQYSALGAIARRWGHPIELSIEKSDDGHNPVGDALIPNVEPYRNTYRLRGDLPGELFDQWRPDSIASFRHLHFPLLFTTRQEMRERAVAGGYLHILEQSWSCTRLRADNTQCGECFCCRGRIRDGVWVERPFARWE